MTWLIALAAALAGSPAGTLNADFLAVGLRPGLAVQLDYGIWKGFFVGGRVMSQQEAYIVAGNLGTFTETGTWYHGAQVGGGVRALLGKRDQWEIEAAVFLGPELTFVRETVVYVNSGQEPPYTVRDRRFYSSWHAGLLGFPVPTVRYRFAKNQGLVFQWMFPLTDPLAIERNYLSLGWTIRWPAAP